MNSTFTFGIDCDCEGVCVCGRFDLIYVYEVTGNACGVNGGAPFVFWETVAVSEADDGHADVMDDVIAQIWDNIGNGISKHWCRIGGSIFMAEWEFETACTRGQVTKFHPSRLTIVLAEIDQSRVAAYV
jgi:hypothetical protein